MQTGLIGLKAEAIGKLQNPRTVLVPPLFVN
jgi:hypothetical protein